MLRERMCFCVFSILATKWHNDMSARGFWLSKFLQDFGLVATCCSWWDCPLPKRNTGLHTCDIQQNVLILQLVLRKQYALALCMRAFRTDQYSCSLRSSYQNISPAGSSSIGWNFSYPKRHSQLHKHTTIFRLNYLPLPLRSILTVSLHTQTPTGASALSMATAAAAPKAAPMEKFRKDYKPVDHVIKTVDLTFKIFDEKTQVRGTLRGICIRIRILPKQIVKFVQTEAGRIKKCHILTVR